MQKIRAKTLLLAFGLGLSLLAAVTISFLLWRAAERARTNAEQRVVQVAANLAFNVDREIERHVTILNTLSTLPSLAARNWSAFYEQAATALRDDGYIVLIDPDLQQIINTFVPFG